MKRLFIFLVLPLFLISCNSEKNTTKQPATTAELVKVEPIKNSAKKVASKKHHRQVVQANNTMTQEVIVVAAQVPHYFGPGSANLHRHANIAKNQDRAMIHDIIVAAIHPHGSGSQLENVHGHPSVASNVHGYPSAASNVHGHPSVASNVHGHPSVASNVHRHSAPRVEVASNGSDVVIYDHD